MAPKQDRIYACGRSQTVALSARMVIGSDDERDLEYVHPGTSTPSKEVDNRKKIINIDLVYTI